MRKTALALLAALILLPSASAGATKAPQAKATPAPRATTAPPRPTAVPTSEPCGFVEFVPVSAPRYQNGTMYERIKARVTFPDGHAESAEFPYLWVYPNGEQTDPWSNTNLKRDAFAVTLQLPPPGAYVDTYPALIKYILAHTDAAGYTTLVDCPKAR